MASEHYYSKSNSTISLFIKVDDLCICIYEYTFYIIYIYIYWIDAVTDKHLFVWQKCKIFANGKIYSKMKMIPTFFLYFFCWLFYGQCNSTQSECRAEICKPFMNYTLSSCSIDNLTSNTNVLVGWWTMLFHSKLNIEKINLLER